MNDKRNMEVWRAPPVLSERMLKLPIPIMIWALVRIVTVSMDVVQTVSAKWKVRPDRYQISQMRAAKKLLADVAMWLRFRGEFELNPISVRDRHLAHRDGVSYYAFVLQAAIILYNSIRGHLWYKCAAEHRDPRAELLNNIWHTLHKIWVNKHYDSSEEVLAVLMESEAKADWLAWPSLEFLDGPTPKR